MQRKHSLLSVKNELYLLAMTAYIVLLMNIMESSISFTVTEKAIILEILEVNKFSSKADKFLSLVAFA